MSNPLESMDLPCPLDLCDGSGFISEDEFDQDSGQTITGAATRLCPHMQDKENDTDY